MRLKQFMEQWFPKTEEWNNVAKFILESGVDIIEEQNQKWLPGYTNISTSHKPHHKDEFTRYMEEVCFMIHDCLHNIFTINMSCGEEEYVERQIHGELFVFYLTEYVIPSSWEGKYQPYISERGCSLLIENLEYYRNSGENIIDYMWRCFIDDSPPIDFECDPMYSVVETDFKKYSKMFQEDLENSRKNYTFVKDLNIEKDCCIVGESSKNHIDFFEAVKKGAIKNIKRDFNLILPKEWI